MASAFEGDQSQFKAGNYPVCTREQSHSVCARFPGYCESRNRSAGQGTVLPGKEFGKRQALLDRGIRKLRIPKFPQFYMGIARLVP